MSEILIQCQDLHKRYGRKEALCGAVSYTHLTLPTNSLV